MNEDNMRGCFRASEIIRAYEQTYTGDDLLNALQGEFTHASAVATLATCQGTRDEWHWRALLYNAAYRRHKAKEYSYVATAA